jgi:hypothetical protein
MYAHITMSDTLAPGVLPEQAPRMQQQGWSSIAVSRATAAALRLAAAHALT